MNDERDKRDTDPVPGSAGEPTSQTLQIPGGSLGQRLDLLEALINKAISTAEHGSNIAMLTHNSVSKLAERVVSHDKRLKKLEYRDAWGPYAVSGVVLVVALIALWIGWCAFARGVR